MATATDFNEESFKWLYTEQAVAFLYLSTAVCVVYDHITTLDEEIELVWNRPKWSMVQYLFFINRYVGDASQIYGAYSMTRHALEGTAQTKSLLSFLHLLHYGTIEVSHIFSIILGYLVTTVLCSMQGIMIYRVSSMYNHSRKIIATFASAIFIEGVVVLSIQSAAYSVHAPVPDPAPGVHLCAQKTFPYWLYTIWIPIIAFESIVLGLSASLGVKYYKTVRILANIQLSSPDPALKLDSLGYILLRDSITFPFICLSACILNMVVWIYLPHIFIQLTFGLAAFAPCVLGPRLILNLREAYYEPFNKECVDGDLPGGPQTQERRESAADSDSAVEDGLTIVTDSRRK